jgi:hypothetical protein
MKFEIAPKSTEIQTNWEDARLYCFSLNIDGKTGWRLPSVYELESFTRSTNMENALYWTGTSYKSYPNGATSIHFGKNSCSVHFFTKESSLWVRAVRDLKDDL